MDVQTDDPKRETVLLDVYHRMTEEIQEQFLHHGYKLVGMADKHSVRLYFLCETMERLLDLRRKLDSGELKKIILQLFEGLLAEVGSSTLWSIEIDHISIVNFDSTQQYFSKYRGTYSTILTVYAHCYFLMLMHDNYSKGRIIM